MPNEPKWIVIRINDYRIEALELSPLKNEEFGPFSAHTIVSTDREAMYRRARTSGGLICKATGVPSIRAIAEFSQAQGSTGAGGRPSGRPGAEADSLQDTPPDGPNEDAEG